MDICKCEFPNPWTDNYGNTTNMCKNCDHKIEEHQTPELGRLHIALEVVLLGELALDPDDPFITHLVNSVQQDIRQKKLIWDNNREIERRAAST
jgi:hypothetical protein